MTEKKTKEINPSNNILVKTGIWYTVCNFLFKAVTFLATPFFSRILSKGEMGAFTNFNSWLLILSVLTAFDLQQSIVLSKTENEEDMDCYIFSILFLTTLVTSVFFLIVFLNIEFFVNLFDTEIKYIYVMFLYLLFTPAYQMFITKHRVYYKYKSFVALTGITIVSSVLLSLALVFLLEDKLEGRTIGNYLPYIIIGFILYLLIALRGKHIKLQYWKYSLTLCLPLVPHVLSLFLLSSSDKIIITKLCGNEFTALYSMAYNVYNIVVVLFESMNRAWAPWLIENLHMKKYREIKEISKIYIFVFLVLILGIQLLAPEAIFVLGGKQYRGTEYCLIPLIASCVFQFIYTMYVNIEFYKKKTVMVSVATMIATTTNIILNLIFIPVDLSHGHVIAAYTTLTGYIILFILHYLLVKKMNMTYVYDTKFILKMLGLILVISGIMNVLYQYNIIRYAVLIVYVVIIVLIGLKNKDRVFGNFFQKNVSM